MKTNTKMTLLKPNKPLMICAFLTFSLFLYIPLTSSQELEEYIYTPGTKIGPEHWGDIQPNWTVCGTGHKQSPIDLLDRRVEILPHLGKLIRKYHPGKAVLENHGHDIELTWKEDAGNILIDGIRYDLKRLHWHSPSEHTINGHKYDLEIHMVHSSTDGKIAVVGTLYKYGHPDPFLAKLASYINKISMVENGEEDVGEVNPREVKRGSKKYYRYIGSLTTPPCTEGVVWTIVKKVRTVSKEQVRMLKEAVNEEFKNNARPVQKKYDRIIDLYRP